MQAADVKRRARVGQVFVVLFEDFAEGREVDVDELFELEEPLPDGVHLHPRVCAGKRGEGSA